MVKKNKCNEIIAKPTVMTADSEEIDEEIPLYGNKEKSIADFFRETFLKNKPPSSLETVVYWTGAGIGILAVSFTIPYSYEFGHDNLGFHSEIAKQSSGLFFVVVGTGALAALSGRITAMTWQSIVRNITSEEKKVMKKISCFSIGQLKSVLLGGTLCVVGLISASPNFLITNSFFGSFSEILAIPLDITTILGISTIRSWALYTLSTRIYSSLKFNLLNRNKDKCNEIRVQRLKIRKYLMQTKGILLSASDAQIDSFYNAVKNAENIDSQENMLNRIKYLFKPDIHSDMQGIKPYKESWPKYSFKMLGSVIGILYPYTAYVLAADASDEIWEYCGVENEIFIKTSSITFGIVCYSTVAALSAIAANDIFDKFYSGVGSVFKNILIHNNGKGNGAFFCATKKNLISAYLSELIFVLSICSAAPKVEIAVDYVPENFYGALVVFCAVIVGFTGDYWAWSALKDEKMYGKTHRQILVKMIESLIDKLENLEDKYVTKLFEIGQKLEPRNPVETIDASYKIVQRKVEQKSISTICSKIGFLSCKENATVDAEHMQTEHKSFYKKYCAVM